MRKEILFILLFAFLSAGCDDKNDVENNSITKNSIAGTWNLVKITSSIGAPGYEYEKGVITWTFTNANSKVAIANTANSTYSGMGTGYYDYVVSPTTSGICNELLTVKDNTGIGGCVTVTTDSLKVFNAYAGHYNFIFVR